MNQHVRILFFIFAFYGSLGAQTYTLQSNQVKATIHVNGAVFTDGQNGGFKPLQSGLPELTLLNGSGLWIAGKSPAGALKGAVERLSSTDFRPGVLDPFSGLPLETLTDIWPVFCSDLSQHWQDFTDNGTIDSPNPRVFAYPGKGNPFFSEYNPSAPELPFTAQALASYYDRDGDALYAPTYGDIPSVNIRGCFDIFAEELAWSAFNDMQELPHTSGLAPLNMEIQRQVFVLKTLENTLLDNVVFVRYKLINRGAETLDSCVIGIYSDIAIGNPADDFIGSLPGQQMVFAYNGDDNDEGGFGINIPVLGMELLRGPLSPITQDSLGQLNLSSALSISDPENRNAAEIYHLLKGNLPDGTPAPGGGFMFSGDPNLPGSNSEIAAGSTPGKRRSLMSTGPFELQPGAVNEFIVAYYYVYEPGASALQEISILLQQAQEVRDLFDNCFENTQSSCSQLLEAPEGEEESGMLIYPNPAAEKITIESTKAGFSQIEIRDMLGRVIQRITLPASLLKYELQVGHLASGMYSLRVEGKGFPVVIQR